MGMLTIVRHGQASLHAEDYDQLSPLGEAQSKDLARYWLSMNHRWDQIWLGPRKRHRQTHDAVATMFSQAGVAVPNTQEHAAFDEHQGIWVVKALLDNQPGVEGTSFVPKDGLKDPETKRKFMAQFRDIMRAWVREEHDFPQFETWKQFRRRIEQGLEDVLRQQKGTERTVIYSSAGPLAAAVGHCLGLDDLAVLELNWPIRNTAIAEFRTSSHGLSLVSFNTLPHLQKAEDFTLV